MISCRKQVFLNYDSTKILASNSCKKQFSRKKKNIMILEICTNYINFLKLYIIILFDIIWKCNKIIKFKNSLHTHIFQTFDILFLIKYTPNMKHCLKLQENIIFFMSFFSIPLYLSMFSFLLNFLTKSLFFSFSEEVWAYVWISAIQPYSQRQAGYPGR